MSNIPPRVVMIYNKPHGEIRWDDGRLVWAREDGAVMTLGYRDRKNIRVAIAAQAGVPLSAVALHGRRRTA